MKFLTAAPAVLMLTLAGCVTTSIPEAAAPILPSYNCVRTPAPIALDGRVDEPAWSRAVPITRFYELGEALGVPHSRTEARLLWDDHNLYVGIIAHDDDICAWGTGRDSNIFSGDVVEVFLKPHADRQDYYELDVSPTNTFFDAYYAYPEGGQWRFAGWNSTTQTATHIDGTLDNWQDQDTAWSAEYRIPFATLPSLQGRAPQAGDRWRFHVARYNYSVYFEIGDKPPDTGDKLGHEAHSCAPMVTGFHTTDRFAHLVFQQ